VAFNAKVLLGPAISGGVAFLSRFAMDQDDASAQGDKDATHAMRTLTRLWVRSQATVSAYITANVSDLHHAEDLVQEVAQVAAEQFAQYDTNRSFTAWTLGIARLRVLKYYRSQSRDRLVLNESALERLADALEELAPQAERRREALRNCLERVEGQRREAVQLRYHEGLAVSEIAEKLATSPSSVSVMLHRIRKSLLECIQRRLTDA
jgi:RNA polymerase sigma-70 factor (ECF subfamily)